MSGREQVLMGGAMFVTAPPVPDRLSVSYSSEPVRRRPVKPGRTATQPVLAAPERAGGHRRIAGKSIKGGDNGSGQGALGQTAGRRRLGEPRMRRLWRPGCHSTPRIEFLGYALDEPRVIPWGGERDEPEL